MPIATKHFVRRLVVVASVVLLGLVYATHADDASQLGFTSRRNNVAPSSEVPASWSRTKRVKWCRSLGTITNGSPVIADGKVFIGTNNGTAFRQRYPRDVDLGVLLCIDEATGHLLWQYSSEKLATGKMHDWPEIGICSTPVVESDRLWFVSNRGEVVCLDAEGFLDKENDGQVTDEVFTGTGEADVVWRLDMMKELGVRQHNMANCSATVAGNVLLVCTSNGVDRAHRQVAVPAAPSFLGLDKRTGRVIWSDNSPGENILHGQWSSPAAGNIGGTTQAIFAGGDGWLYSFDPRGDGHGGGRLLWKFDCNPKAARWGERANCERNNIVSMPVIDGDCVYVATGKSPDRAEGRGRLWCVNATKTRAGADVSEDLVFGVDSEHIAARRLQAFDRARGETIRANPDTAAVWCYTGGDWDGDGKVSYHERMHRSIASVAICDGLLVAVDTSGVVHCIDASSGQAHWTFDTLCEIWASALIVKDRVFVADTGGTVSIFELTADPRCAMRVSDGKFGPLARWEFGDAIHSTATLSKGVLYVPTMKDLHALELSQPQQRLEKPGRARSEAD